MAPSNPIAKRLKFTEKDAEEPSVNDLRASIDQREQEADEEEEAPAAPTTDPRKNREYPFQFKVKDGTGRLFEGRFRSRALSIGDRLKAGVLAAELMLGARWEALPKGSQDYAIMISQLEYALVERPEWANKLRDLDDENVLIALFGEVAQHQATFLGREDAPPPAAKS